MINFPLILAGLQADATDSSKPPEAEATPVSASASQGSPEKRITFTLAPSDSSPEGSQTLTPKKFEPIVEEDKEDGLDEVILRPRLIDRHPHLLPDVATSPKRTLRSAKSVPHMMMMATSEVDIFAITGTGSQISMTPEVPSISFSNLPKNYEDTPTIEKYRVSQSLYSIQNANAARASKDDYSMPRYFRRSNMLNMTQSTEMLPGSTSLASISATSTAPSTSSSKDELRQPKSKRLQMLRGNLPPLLIHSVSFKRNRDEGKQLN